MSETRIVRILVEGRVQGVGYRAFLRRAAAQRALRGFVRNLADGRVEAVAGGAAEAIDDLVALARRGPPGAHVSELRLEAAQEAALGDAQGFVVAPSI